MTELSAAAVHAAVSADDVAKTAAAPQAASANGSVAASASTSKATAASSSAPAGETVAAAVASASASEAAASTAECDPRIARSRAALREAFIALVEENGLDGFSVGDLCSRAGLNRGTFYNHFHDKENLLASFEAEVFQGLGGVLAKLQKISIPELALCSARKRPLPVLVEMFDYLREEGPFLHAVLGPGGDAAFGMQLREQICGGFVRSLLHERYRNDSSAFTRYYISFYSGAYLGVITEWIASGMNETSEEMALIAMRLLFIKPGESIKM